MPRKGQRFYDDDDDYDYYEDDYDEDYGRQDPDASTSGQSASSKSGRQQQQQQQQQRQQESEWDCKICTFINPGDLRACEMCGVVPNCEDRDSARKTEASELARSLFTPLPPPEQKKGTSPAQLRERMVSKDGSSQLDDIVLGVQTARRALQPRSNAADVKKPKASSAVAAVDPGASKTKGKHTTAAKLDDAESRDLDVVEQLKKSMTITGGDSESNPQRLKYKGLPLDAYKPEPWMLQSGRTTEKSLLHLVVVGHVDAGKSTLMGRILHTVGRISQKEMHKNQKEATEMGKASFAYAWALDEGAEERARGITMTVAVAHFETPKLRVVLLDAPGHKDFVPNMISGASQADAAVLVVDASAGNFEAGMGAEGKESGQTREHAQLARSLGISQLIVAVNKMDAADYSQGRFEEIKLILAPFLRQCGFRDSAVVWVPVSASSGQNLIAGPSDASFKQWYKGDSLLDALDKFVPPERDVTRPFRLAVAEAVRTRSLGATGAGGKIETGAIKVGAKVMVMPQREIGIVKYIEQDGKSKQTARAGDSIDVGLQGVDPSFLVTGGVLCHPDYLVPIATRFEARILTLKISMPIISGSQVVLHVHHAKEAATVRLTSLLDAKSGLPTKASPRCLTSGQNALVEVVPERGVCVEEYSNFRSLGRVILRREGRTLAVGIITRVLSTQ